ncbi:MAG: sodium-dependent transporter [Gammaproteobacteria bacterium]|nr:sodium-dependent transporter [Gammaproteobacteria bacterium]
MSVLQKPKREHWSSEYTFILAALGSAVGLGNIWRFPYVAGENGGGAFVILYLMLVIGIGLPALIATIMIGRRGQSSPINCFEIIASDEKLNRKWTYLGWLLVLSAYFLLTFFSVVASWTFDYLIKALSGQFEGLDADTSVIMFNQLKSDPLRLSLWHGLFMGLTLIVVGRGIRKGIEKAIKLMMPTLFFLLIILAIYSLVAGDARAALQFLFSPDFPKLNANAVLLATGQAMLSLSVGGAGMLVYGAYLNKETSIPRTSIIIAGVDTLVALLTGLIIFPIVFAYGLQPGSGPGLIFVTLPIAFGQMPGGALFGVLFFVLLLLAAQTSAFSMFEPVVAWIEENKGISRKWAALITGSIAWFIGLATVFSFNIWRDVRPLWFISKFQEMSIFRVLEYLVTSICIPAGTLMVAVFVGWFISEHMRTNEYGISAGRWYLLWRSLIRYLVPVCVLLIFYINL